ncbi:MAG: chemotaxis protein CheW [Planctomycetes bacterium]|nr:chemotaxis protein CheW [Planctomycetota bacterium]
MRLEDVVKTLPFLPIEPVRPPTQGVLGLCRVHGEPLPVIDLATAFGAPSASGSLDEMRTGSMVALRVAGRQVVIVVEAIEGIHAMTRAAFRALPPLIEGIGNGGPFDAIGDLDSQFIGIIQASRLLSDDLLALPSGP